MENINDLNDFIENTKFPKNKLIYNSQTSTPLGSLIISFHRIRTDTVPAIGDNQNINNFDVSLNAQVEVQNGSISSIRNFLAVETKDFKGNFSGNRTTNESGKSVINLMDFFYLFSTNSQGINGFILYDNIGSSFLYGFTKNDKYYTTGTINSNQPAILTYQIDLQPLTEDELSRYGGGIRRFNPLLNKEDIVKPILTFYSWDLSGNALPRVSFDWKCIANLNSIFTEVAG